MRRCHDDEVALDLVAKTFAQAWCVRRAFRDEAGGSAAPWLYGIARYVLLQSVRRERLEDSARQRLGALEHADRPRVAPQESWLEGVDELFDTRTDVLEGLRTGAAWHQLTRWRRES